MDYRVRWVDTSKLYWRNLICGLQLTCLPYDEIFTPTEGSWFVAFSPKDGPVGFAGMVPSAQFSDCVYLCRAGVKEAHRGHGLQKKLIYIRLKRARIMGMNWAVTDTYDNPASANSLISTGFRVYDPSKPWGMDGATYWRKKLNDAVQRPRKT